MNHHDHSYQLLFSHPELNLKLQDSNAVRLHHKLPIVSEMIDSDRFTA